MELPFLHFSDTRTWFLITLAETFRRRALFGTANREHFVNGTQSISNTANTIAIKLNYGLRRAYAPRIHECYRRASPCCKVLAVILALVPGWEQITGGKPVPYFGYSVVIPASHLALFPFDFNRLVVFRHTPTCLLRPLLVLRWSGFDNMASSKLLAFFFLVSLLPSAIIAGSSGLNYQSVTAISGDIATQGPCSRTFVSDSAI
jgi:hypothetical protein